MLHVIVEVRLPFKGLNGVAYERSVEKRAELFGCRQAGSLPGPSGGKNHGHGETDGRRRFVSVSVSADAAATTRGTARCTGAVRVIALVHHTSRHSAVLSVASRVNEERVCMCVCCWGVETRWPVVDCDWTEKNENHFRVVLAGFHTLTLNWCHL